MKKKIVSDLLYYFLNVGLISVIGYLFFIIIGKMLLPDEYGILVTVLALLNILLPVTTLGFNEAIAKFIPLFIKKDKDKIKNHVKFIYKRVILFSLIISSIIFVFSKEIAITFYGNESMTVPFKILSILLVLGSVTLTTKGILQGFKLFREMFKFDLISHILRLIIPILLIYYFGMGVSGGLAGWLVCFAIFILASTFFIIKIVPSGEGAISNDIWKYGISSALSSSGFTLLLQTGVLLLSFLDFKTTGLFGVALILGELFLFLPIIISGVILPYISELFSKNDIKTGIKIIELSLKNLFLFLFPFIFITIFFSRKIIIYLYNAEYIGSEIFVLPFVIGSFLLGLTMVMLTVLYAAGHPITKLKVTWLMVLLNIALSLTFISVFGPVGAAYGFLASQILSFILIVSVIRKKINLKLPEKSEKIALISIGFVILNYLINRFYINFYVSLMLLAVSLALYFYMLLRMGIFDEKEMELFNTMKNILFKKLK